jgi:predicted transposase/invertase (TIGR01784 family)
MKRSDLTPEEMEQYKTSVLEYDSIKAAVRFAKQEAREEALEEGIEKGRIQVAKEGLQMGMSVEQVAKLTKLSIAKVEDILQNLKQ